MNDAATDRDTLRADVARENLLKDIRKLKEMGGNMVQKTETALSRAPVVIGVGAAGIALVGLVVWATRRPKPLLERLTQQRSFVGEALRGAALSALSVLAQRVAQRAIAGMLVEAPEAEPAVRAAAE